MGTKLGRYGGWDGGRKRGISIPRDGGMGTEMEVGMDEDIERQMKGQDGHPQVLHGGWGMSLPSPHHGAAV